MERGCRTVKTDRNSKYELIRIISMVMIVVSHWSLFGIQGTNGIYETMSWLSRLFTKAIGMFGGVGVNLFIFISGYLGI